MTQAEGLYQALFQHAGDAIVLIDAALMTIVAANPAAAHLSGYLDVEDGPVASQAVRGQREVRFVTVVVIPPVRRDVPA